MSGTEHGTEENETIFGEQGDRWRDEDNPMAREWERLRSQCRLVFKGPSPVHCEF